MSLLLATALAASAATLPACSWDKPGVNPFVGNVVAAVDRYTDIPPETRARLKQRMATRQYDEIAAIRRDSITGKAHQYSAQLRDMHFGKGKVCREVTRQGWSDSAVERGLVYCEGEHCLIVPTVCRNLSRVTRLPGTQIAGTRADDDLGLAPAPPLLETRAPEPVLPGAEPVFDPPGAGLPSVTGAAPGADLPAAGGVPWPVGALPIGGGGAPIGFAKLDDLTSAVHEPATGLLMLAGAALLAAAVRRRPLVP